MIRLPLTNWLELGIFFLTSVKTNCLLLCPFPLNYVTYKLPNFFYDELFVIVSIFHIFCHLQIFFFCPYYITSVTYKLHIFVFFFCKSFQNQLSVLVSIFPNFCHNQLPVLVSYSLTFVTNKHPVLVSLFFLLLS